MQLLRLNVVVPGTLVDKVINNILSIGMMAEINNECGTVFCINDGRVSATITKKEDNANASC